eukprot:753796-Hanusia_phi.AAC.5
MPHYYALATIEISAFREGACVVKETTTHVICTSAVLQAPLSFPFTCPDVSPSKIGHGRQELETDVRSPASPSIALVGGPSKTDQTNGQLRCRQQRTSPLPASRPDLDLVGSSEFFDVFSQTKIPFHMNLEHHLMTMRSSNTCSASTVQYSLSACSRYSRLVHVRVEGQRG